MADYLGNILVPDIVASGVFPLVSDYGYGFSSQPIVTIHQFGSGNAKIEQRFLLGNGAKRFTVRRSFLKDNERVALRNFWESKYGPYGAFTYNAPNDNGHGTTAYTCRFENEPLSWQMVSDWACSIGVTLVELPSSAPEYTLNSTVVRFPTEALETALLSQEQRLIPLIKIAPLLAGYPAIYVSDRRCTVGGQLYQARLLSFDGISQSIGNEADDASFTFGNADRVMRDLTNDVDLYRAVIEFSLFHVGTGIKIDLWKGDVVDWSFDAGPEFRLTAADGLYELNLPYPTRKVSRSCWKSFDSVACPFATSSTGMDLVHFPSAITDRCDKGYDTPNGCLAHGMKRYYGGVLVDPQGVRIRDNSTGVWGFGRSALTSTSVQDESIYDQVMQEVYTDSDMPVNCKLAAGRDESDFYEALGIVGEGPLTAYTVSHMIDKDGDGTQETFVGHSLDGQFHHGYGTINPNLGLRTVLGSDPAGEDEFFSLDQSGNHVNGDFRKVYYGDSTYKDNFAAGTAFVVIRKNDAKGLQLSKPGDHAMVAYVNKGLCGWIWTTPGTRVWNPFTPLTNPVWIAVNMLLRARGVRLGANATTDQLDYAETFFDVEAAIAAAAICDDSVTKLVGSGSETQFKFRGVFQEEKPLRDWLQEVLMNCLGYYTFEFGKFKVGIRVNSSSVEAFTEGNILFNSLQLTPLKPTFNHITANFADEDFDYVANSLAVYDIDHASYLGGAAGPLFLKSNMNLCGTFSKSQASRIVSVRLREELGGTNMTEWRKARRVSFRTTILSLNTEPGMVCSMTHPDMPGGAGEFRITGWKLNNDYSIDVQGRTTTDSMYDLVDGPKPADVIPSPVPEEIMYDTGVPGYVTGDPVLGDYGTFSIDNIVVNPDDTGNANINSAHEIAMAVFYVDELATDLWASLDADLDKDTDGPAVINCTVNPDTMGVFKVGDFVVFNDEDQDIRVPGRRSYECAQIVGPGNEGDVVLSGEFQIQRAWPGADPDNATFETLRCDHKKGIRFYRLSTQTFTYSVKKGFFRTPGLPAKITCNIPTVAIVAALVGVGNNFGYGPFTVWSLSRHAEPFMPGMRTCSGGAYTFQIPGPLAAASTVVIPMRVQDSASLRSVYAYLQEGTIDGQSAFLVKYREEGGEWKPLEYMGIAQASGEAYKNTYDWSVQIAGKGKPDTRRLPYNEFGITIADAITAGVSPQTVQTSSYGANRLGLDVGEFVHVNMGGEDEEYVRVLEVDEENQTFQAVFSINHEAGARIMPTIWPTTVMKEGYEIAFDVLGVASPDPGSDLTVVVQT